MITHGADTDIPLRSDVEGILRALGAESPLLLVGLMDRSGDRGIFQINICHTRNQGIHEFAQAMKPHLVQQLKFDS